MSDNQATVVNNLFPKGELPKLPDVEAKISFINQENGMSSKKNLCNIQSSFNKNKKEKAFGNKKFAIKGELPDLSTMCSNIKPQEDEALNMNNREVKKLNAGDNGGAHSKSIKSTVELIWWVKNDILRKFFIRVEQNQRLIFVYKTEDGFFKSLDRITFETFLREVYCDVDDIDQYLSSRLVTEVFQRLITEPKHQVTMRDFETNMYLINIKNGVLDIRSKIVYPHDPKYMFLKVVPVNYEVDYNPGASQFKAAIEQACSEEDNRKFLLEAMGYLISNYYGKKIAFVFKGMGNSGKTMLLNLIVLFAGGPDFVASIPLASFDKSFALAEFSKKNLNIVGELDTKALRTNAMVKSVIGGDLISAEFKHRDKFSFQCRTKNVFAINNFFNVEGGDKEEALFDRFQFVEFDGVVPKADRIPHYENILFEQERDGIFYLFVKMLYKLYKKNFQFTLSSQAKRMKKEFMGMKNPVEHFIHDKCVVSSNHRISSRELFDAYDEYRVDNCFPVLSEIKFGREVSHITCIEKSRARYNKRSIWGYIGIGLKPEESFVNEDEE